MKTIRLFFKLAVYVIFNFERVILRILNEKTYRIYESQWWYSDFESMTEEVEC